MAAPKIKMYKLPRYFNSDNLAEDRVSKTNDELLPIKEKRTSPEDIAMYCKLTGIRPGEDKFVENLIKVSSSGEITANLILEDISDSFSFSGSTDFNSGVYSIEIDPLVGFTPIMDGIYALKVMIGEEVVPKDGYELSNQTIIAKDNYRYMTFTSVKYYNVNNGASSNFSSKFYPVYDGGNSFFKPFVFELKENAIPVYKTVEGEQVLTNHASEMIFYKRVDSLDRLTETYTYYLDSTNGLITIPSAVDNLYMSYVVPSNYARTYIGEHANWVTPNEWETAGGHMYLAPDVYVGWTIYTPSSFEDASGAQISRANGQPCFVEPGNYSISYRNGSVSFASEFDNTEESNTAPNAGKAGCVYVAYSHVCGVVNVDGQVFERETFEESDSYPYGEDHFDPSKLSPGDRVYFPSRNDYRDEKSKGAMWVGTTNNVMVKNVYVTYYNEAEQKYVTEQKPVIVKFDPYDQLTVKTSD